MTVVKWLQSCEFVHLVSGYVWRWVHGYWSAKKPNLWKVHHDQCCAGRRPEVTVTDRKSWESHQRSSTVNDVKRSQLCAVLWSPTSGCVKVVATSPPSALCSVLTLHSDSCIMFYIYNCYFLMLTAEVPMYFHPLLITLLTFSLNRAAWDYSGAFKINDDRSSLMNRWQSATFRTVTQPAPVLLCCQGLFSDLSTGICYSRTSYNPYPSVDGPGYGFSGVMGLQGVGEK